MNSVWTASVLLLVTLPTLARGADLLPKISQSVLYESNVYRDTQDAQGDFILRAAPSLRLRERKDKIRYEVYYWLPFERGLKTNKRFELDHNLGGDFSADLTSRTHLSFRDSLRISSVLRNEREEVEDEEGTLLEVSNEDFEVIQNRASLAMRHRFGRQLSGNFTVSHRLFHTDQPDRSDVQTVGTNGSLNYAINSRHTVGGGLGITRQAFDERADTAASETFFYSASASWSYRVSESLSFSVRAGPSFVTSEQDDPERSVDGVFPFWYWEGSQGEFWRVQQFPSDPDLYPNQSFPIREVGDGDLVLDAFDSCAYLSGVQDPDEERVLVRGGCSGKVVVPSGDTHYDAIETLTVDALPGPLTFEGAEPPGKSDSRFALFGSVSLRQRWSPTLVSAFNYSRRESDASGLGGSTVVDSVSLTTSWKPSPRWRLALRTGWTQRKSLFPQTRTFWVVTPESVYLDGFAEPFLIAKRTRLRAVESDRSIDTQRWGVALRVTRELFRNASTTLNVRYNNQKSRSGTSGASSDFDNFIVQLGFQYTFDPIQLW